jgi:hypothetical protein
MAHLSIAAGILHIRLGGFDRILTLTGELTVPLAHITAVSPRPLEAHAWFHGLRVTGTALPGVVAAGEFLTAAGLVFFDVHQPDQTIALDVAHDEYRRIIVQVDETPEAAVARIQAALQPG